MSKAKAEELGLEYLAEIVAYGQVAGPDSSLHSPAEQRDQGRTAKSGDEVSDLSVIEINEAFALVGIQSTKDLGVDPEIVNPNGGAIALGHPIGASGARLVLTLAHELKHRGGGLGAAALCGGGGQGDALLLRCRPLTRSDEAVVELADRAKEGDQRALGRLITLVENGGAQVRQVAAALPVVHRAARVIGLTGSPGVGKSTTTTALVTGYRKQGLRVAVLAVDPSSPFTGGAILGDRVRMQEHALDPEVFHPIDVLARSPGWSRSSDTAGPKGPGSLRFRCDPDRDRRRRASRGGHCGAGGHHVGSAGSRHG